MAPDWLIGTGLADCNRIGFRLADWHWIGRLAPDWPIGTRLDWIGSDWQIEKFVSQGKIGPRLAPDWHGLAWIGTDWHGLARIGRLANLCRNQKLTPDWHGIGMDWHGLARIGSD